MKQINEVDIEIIKVGDRYRKDMGDLQSLVASIEELGLLQPIGINPDYQLIWGERRLRAFQLLGRSMIPARIVPIVEIVLGEYAENEIRKNFTISESAEIYKAQKAAKSKSGNNQFNKSKEDCNDHYKADERTDNQAAKAAGFNSQFTAIAAEKVIDNGEPELVKAMDDGRVAITSAADISDLPPEQQIEILADKNPKAFEQAAKKRRQEKTEQRREQRIEKLKEQAAGNQDMDTSCQYPVIYADPPWNYDFSGSDNRDLDNQYPTMDLESILGMPVDQLATSDCVLFLWTTAPKLPEGMEVLDRWGFTYKTCAIWDKEKIGMGYWFRQQSELLLVATRGSIPPPEPSNRPSSVIRSPREKHSQKPEKVYQIIEAMYPDLPRIELFARNRREGWSAFGNEHAH